MQCTDQIKKFFYIQIKSISHQTKFQMFQDNSQMRFKPVSNVQKSFSSECQICYEQFNNTDRIPMIICTNYHSLCLNCVKENLFKKQYDQKKNHTGRYKCSKCSEIIKNDQIRQHKMLKQICQNLTKIKQKDEQLKKQLYNSIGTMGMNLLSKTLDNQIIQKNYQSLKHQNLKLIEENIILKSKLQRIQQIKGSLQHIQKVDKQLKQLNYQKVIAQASLFSLFEQNKRQSQKLQELQENCEDLTKQIKNKTERKNNLIEQIEGQINLKEYLQQQILQLKSLRKHFQKQLDLKKQKFNLTLNQMEKSWKKFININLDSEKQSDFFLQNQKKSILKLQQKKKQQKQNLILKSNDGEKMRKTQKLLIQNNKQVVLQHQVSSKLDPNQTFKQEKFIIDLSQKSVKNFNVKNNIVTLSNNRSGSYSHFSSQYPIQQLKNMKFQLKILQTQDFSLMFGLISADGKNKKNLYNRNSFVGLDCSDSGRVWVQGQSVKTQALKLSLKDIIGVELNLKSNEIKWFCNDRLIKSINISANLRNKKLYPVILMISSGDKIQLMNKQVKN